MSDSNPVLVQLPYKPSPPPRKGKAGINRPSALTQALDLRDFAAASALDLQSCSTPDLNAKVTRARALRDLTSVWDIACDRARVLRGKPMPGSLRPEPVSKSKRRLPSVLPEPVPE